MQSGVPAQSLQFVASFKKFWRSVLRGDRVLDNIDLVSPWSRQQQQLQHNDLSPFVVPALWLVDWLSLWDKHVDFVQFRCLTLTSTLVFLMAWYQWCDLSPGEYHVYDNIALQITCESEYITGLRRLDSELRFFLETAIHRRSKVSVQNSQAGQHDESRPNFKVMYIHELGHYASLLSVLLLNWI